MAKSAPGNKHARTNRSAVYQNVKTVTWDKFWKSTGINVPHLVFDPVAVTCAENMVSLARSEHLIDRLYAEGHLRRAFMCLMLNSGRSLVDGDESWPR